MATEKRPTIYQDRGTIGSSDELDKYGVWVKSGPQDLTDDEDTDIFDTADSDAQDGFDSSVDEIEPVDFDSFDSGDSSEAGDFGAMDDFGAAESADSSDFFESGDAGEPLESLEPIESDDVFGDDAVGMEEPSGASDDFGAMDDFGAVESADLSDSFEPGDTMDMDAYADDLEQSEMGDLPDDSGMDISGMSDPGESELPSMEELEEASNLSAGDDSMGMSDDMGFADLGEPEPAQDMMTDEAEPDLMMEEAGEAEPDLMMEETGETVPDLMMEEIEEPSPDLMVEEIEEPAPDLIMDEVEEPVPDLIMEEVTEPASEFMEEEIEEPPADLMMEETHEMIGDDETPESLDVPDDFSIGDTENEEEFEVDGTAGPEVAAFESAEMREPETRKETVHAEDQAKESALSTQLLMKIANELSSIRNELTTLKKELSVIKTEPDQESSKNQGFFKDTEDDEKIALTGDEMAVIGEPLIETHDLSETEEETVEEVQETEASPEGESHGFFKDDEDETISLTTDEMDNILNTADFVEETGADAGEDMPAEESAAPVSGDADIVEENAPADGIEEIEIEPFEEIGPLESDEDIFEDAPSDEDAFPDELSDASDENSMDFSDAVIDEPDLSLDIHDNPVVEPSADELKVEIVDDVIDDPEFETDSGSDEFNMEETIEEVEIPLEEEDYVPLSPEAFISDGDSGGVHEPVEDDDLALIPEGFVVETSGAEAPAHNVASLETEEAAFEDTDSAGIPELPPDDNVPDTTEPVSSNIPSGLKQELRAVLSYMDDLLDSLPDSKIEEFARSEHFDTYKKLFKELGLV